MKVDPTDENMVFRVYSADGDGSYYTVALTENNGIGACTCTDFGTRCQKQIDARTPFVDYPKPGRHHCKHLHATFLFLGKMVAARAMGTTVDKVFKA